MLYKCILKACVQAIKSKDFKYSHHGCVIANNRYIFALGHNKKGNLSKFKQYGYNGNSIHAEADAVLNLLNNFGRNKQYCQIGEKFFMVVVRFKNGKLQNSRPCNECLRLIKKKRNIVEVYYSNEDGSIICLNMYNNEEYIVDDSFIHKLKVK